MLAPESTVNGRSVGDSKFVKVPVEIVMSYRKAYSLNRKNLEPPEMGLVTQYCPSETVGELVQPVQFGGLSSSEACSVKPT